MLCKIFYYVTDRGADNGIGCSGWLIATDTKIITKGYRQAHGSEHQMESLQVETYEGIAVFNFIKHYRIFYEISEPPILQKYYCDNFTLISRLKYNQTGSQYPSLYTQAKYDVHMTLVKLVQDTSGTLEIAHVKGHQDSKKNKTK
eukprot:15339289-Ditylum_brightwellii.AAC.1